MSRCYPYPFPGYEKKANVQPALSPKKEKHKHKDKKRKRRKESETNGDLQQRDSDKRSKGAHQSGVLNDGIGLAKRIIPDTKATALSSSEAVHEKVTQKLLVHEKVTEKVQAASLNAEVCSVGVLAVNGKRLGTITKQGRQLSLVRVRAACSSNGGAAVATEVAPSKSEVKLRRESCSQYVPQVEKVWSPLDDQEWLFLHNALVPTPVCTNKQDESHSFQVRAEAVLLSSVGIYALPYVVPDR